MKALLAVLLAACTFNAHALSTASLTLTGDTALLGTTITLVAGEQRTFTFDYDITVSDQGLPATWDYVNIWVNGPIVEFIPGNGWEFAGVNIALIWPCFRNCPSYLVLNGDDIAVLTNPDASADFIHQTGTLTLSALLLPGQGFDHETVGMPRLHPNTFAFSSLVPEPATYAMLLGGLLLVGAASRRSRRAVAGMSFPS